MRSLTEQEIIDRLQWSTSFVKPGEVPRHNGKVQLFEKEYVGRAKSMDAAIDLAIRTFKADHRGERIYARSLIVHGEGVEYVAIFTAALRVAPMDFSQILLKLKAGERCRRAGWNGAGQHVHLLGKHEVGGIELQPGFVLYNAQKQYQPGWVPSMGDMMAEDWEVLDPKQAAELA